LEPAVKRGEFVAEGLLELGPRTHYFLFFEGDFLWRVLAQHIGVESIDGEYTRLGRARITAEWIEDDELTEEASPT
jgi:hypothetical protein